MLAAAVVVALVFVVPWIRIFLVLRGTRLSPVDGVAGVADAPLQACELAAVGELESWGFERRRDGFDRLGWEPIRTLFFAHRELPHFARLQLRGTVPIGLPVTFVSFTADGAPIATINRTRWALALGCDSLNSVDARADSVEAQWDFHRERAAQAQALAPEVAADRIEAAIERDRAEALATGRWIRGRHFVQPAFASAWRATADLMRDRRLLQRPLDSAATRGGAARSFLTVMLETQERLQAHVRTERSIKVVLLVATLAVAWLLWGALFDWHTAAELIAIVLVHEMGHAVAMRAFGWTNLHVFFVPMMGAVATGGRPRAPAAWKDVVVLLAGPVPGLAAGLAVLASPLAADPQWRSVALMAASVNAFNLLPLAPLDGGQLMAIALFNRWPYVRLAFTMLSAAGIFAVGWLLKAPTAYIIALLLALGWRREVRLAAIERHAARSVGANASIADVCEAVCVRQPTLALLQRSGLAQLVLRRRQVPQAGVALGLAVVAGLGVAWALAAPPLAKAFMPSTRAHQDRRTQAQRAFDKDWVAMRLVAASAALPGLLADAGRLAPQDPRRGDVAWLRTQTLSSDERAGAVDRWLAGDRGYRVSRNSVARTELRARIADSEHQAPADRVGTMRAATAWAHALPVSDAGIDVSAQLRLAEAIDLSGDEAAARRMLDAIVGSAVGHDECRCRLEQAVEARAWFESTHDRPREAMRVLDGAVARTLGAPERTGLGVVRAWATLQGGDSKGGLEQMRSALRADQLDADFRLRDNPGDDGDDGFDVWYAPELAVALHAAGRRDDARRLCRNLAAEECADAAGRSVGDTVAEGPWQARHIRERTLLMRAIAPPSPRP